MPLMLTCMPVNTLCAHLDTALEREKHVPISYLRGLSNLWSKTGKEGIIIIIMCEGHSEQQLQRAVTVPLGLQTPDCTCLGGSTPPHWSHAHQS